MAFDTQQAARRLTDAGLDERAAMGIADVVQSATSGLATEASLLATEASLHASMLDLRAELHQVETRMVRWTVATMLAGMAAAAAIAAATAQLIGP